MIGNLSFRSDIEHVSFIDPMLRVVASSEPGFLGMTIRNEYIKEHIADHEFHVVRMALGGEKETLFASLPVIYEDEFLGTLALGWDTKELDSEYRRIVLNALIQFVLLLLFMGGILYYAYKKNTANIKAAFYDETTGLPNRRYLVEYLEDAKRHPEYPSAIILIQLNNLKTLATTYGAKYANQVYAQIAHAIRSSLRAHESLFSYSDDRFVVIKDHYEQKEELATLSERIIATTKAPMSFAGDHHYLYAEIGIVEVKGERISVDTSLQQANLALSHRKGDPDAAVIFFKDEMEGILLRQRKIKRALRAIIAGKDSTSFSLHFQPKLNLLDGSIYGFEALARLRMEDLGPVSPLEFIDIAERELLIHDLSRHILRLACEFVRALHQAGHENQSVAVNISGIQLLRDDFVEDTKQIIESYGIPMRHFEFEITESVLLENYELINEKLARIKNLGIQISLDDFGTGFSSLSRLSELHIDTVKTDRYFTKNISGEDDDASILRDIISMAHKIGKTVVAEGVETDMQMRYLASHGCDIIQGYLFSKPLPQRDVLDFITKATR